MSTTKHRKEWGLIAKLEEPKQSEIREAAIVKEFIGKHSKFDQFTERADQNF